jgi:hypothetical protein
LTALVASSEPECDIRQVYKEGQLSTGTGVAARIGVKKRNSVAHIGAEESVCRQRYAA